MVEEEELGDQVSLGDKAQLALEVIQVHLAHQEKLDFKVLKENLDCLENRV